MIFTDMSIGEFLETNLKAPIWENYAAFIVPIVRTADGKDLQDELIGSWDSLDDLTNDRILVIMPRPPEQHRRAIVPIPYGVYGINNDLSILGGRQSTIWESVLRKANSEILESLPPSKGREALTKVATETARFFGIPEQYLPCVVTLSIKERCLFILPSHSSFSLHAFIKSMIIEYQPVLDNVQNMKECRKKLEIKEQEMSKINEEVKRANVKYGETKSDADKEKMLNLKREREKLKAEVEKYRLKAQQSKDELNITEQAMPLSKAIYSVSGQSNLEPREIPLTPHSPLSDWHVTLIANMEDQFHMKEEPIKKMKEEEPTKKATRWSELSIILFAFILVMGIIGLIAYFISPFILWLVLIAGLLFMILIIIYLKGPAELSETNFVQIIFRLFDALPLLRPNQGESRRKNDNQQQVNADQTPLQSSTRGSRSNRKNQR